MADTAAGRLRALVQRVPPIPAEAKRPVDMDALATYCVAGDAILALVEAAEASGDDDCWDCEQAVTHQEARRALAALRDALQPVTTGDTDATG